MLQRVRLVQQQPQITSPIRLIAAKREMQQREAFADMPTTHMSVTTGSMRKLPRTTKQMLLMDRQGRAFTMAADSFLDTMTLIEEQIKKFATTEGRYPAEILLSPLRFLAKGGQMTHYSFPHFNVHIPIHFDRSAYEIYNYEVMCRGE